jgi:hypothetical protein
MDNIQFSTDTNIIMDSINNQHSEEVHPSEITCSPAAYFIPLNYEEVTPSEHETNIEAQMSRQGSH